MSKWISVEDERPNETEWVIVYANGAMNFMIYKDSWFHDPTNSDCFNINLHRITHWRHAPKVPEEFRRGEYK